jgi:hypothetical protein
MTYADITMRLSHTNPSPANPSPARPVEQAQLAKTPYQAPCRVGLVPISGFFPKDVRRQLKGLAAAQDRTVQDVLAEAINMVFIAHGKPPLCPRDK